jgi:hypothetical protein
MPGERVATDVVGDELVAVYVRGVRRLERLIAAGLRRGLDADRVGAGDQVRGDATQAYRERQLRIARATIAELERAGPPLARGVTARAYRASLFALDELVVKLTPDARGAIRPAFGGVHQGAVNVLAGNLERSLARATATIRESVDTVFARAAALEGPLPAGGILGTGFVGRRRDDVWRRLALEELGAGQVTLETRRQISANLVRRLQAEGVTDGLTGFVDRAGRRHRLDEYAEMVVRTTTREATSRATDNRMAEHGLDLVAISSHPHRADVCSPYDGQTFSRPGTIDDRYPELDFYPPFHPRCRHVAMPADVNFEDYERELGIAAEREAAGETGPATTTPAPPAPPTEALATPGDVEEGLSIAPLARKVVDPALNAIRKVHKWPAELVGRKLSVRSNPINGHPNAKGAYRYAEFVEGGKKKSVPQDLTINPALGDAGTVLHELGHYVDHMSGPRPGVMSSAAKEPELDEWRQAVENTRTVKAIRRALDSGELEVFDADGNLVTAPLSAQGKRVMKYLLQPEELWARSYNQWVALRAGDLSGLVDWDNNVGLLETQWGAADFAPIAAALDKLFKARGLM